MMTAIFGKNEIVDAVIEEIRFKGYMLGIQSNPPSN
jgi:hypothetical protein